MTADLTRYLVTGKGPDSVSGFQPAFSQGLAAMFAAMPPELQGQVQISSGYRSPQRQAELFTQAVQKYGSPALARKWVAPAGHSQHNHGNAADLRYLNPVALKWAHANAGRFGLAFPLGHENWHVELASARDGAPSSPSPVPSGQTPQPAQNDVAPSPFTAPAPTLGLGETSLASMFVPAQPDPQAEAAKRARREALYSDLFA